MAEGGASAVSKDAFSKASGDADEIFCDPCLHGGKSAAVDGYCEICEEYMCRNCLEVHRNQKLSRGHHISDINQIQSRPKTKVGVGREECIEMCKIHHTEIIRFYCKAHNETGCVNCMVENHANCMKDLIQDITDGFQATEEFKTLHHKLESFFTEIRETKEAISEKLETIGSTFGTIEKKIESFRQEINAYLDEMQKKLLDEISALRREEETSLKQLSTENETLKAEVESIIQNFQNGENVNSSFVLAKQTHKRLVALQDQFNNIQQKEKQQQPKHFAFHPSSDIAKILSSKAPMGTLTRIPDISRITASYRESTNVKASKDGECWINGCTLLDQNRMVVTDGENYKVKLIDLEQNRIMFSYKTSTSPIGITAVTADQVAVTLPDGATLLILNVTGNITKQCEIKLKNCSDKDCWAIAYKDGLFAVSFVNPGRVKILDAVGNVLHTVHPKLENEDFLQCVCGIKFGNDNDTVILSDGETNTISVVSFEGDILQTYTHDILIDPGVIDVTKDGIVFVCCFDNGCVLAVNPDFESSKVLIENEERLAKPYSIAYREINRRLYIGNCIGNDDDDDDDDNDDDDDDDDDEEDMVDKRNNLLHVFELSNI